MTKHKHPALNFLSRMPQFTGVTNGAVAHLRFGTVVTGSESIEPAAANRLTLTWPGQDPAVVITVEAMKYVQLAASEALTIGFDSELIDAELLAYYKHTENPTQQG